MNMKSGRANIYKLDKQNIDIDNLNSNKSKLLEHCDTVNNE